MKYFLIDKEVLVTGATGFIGSHLTRRLLNEGAKVHILIREDSNISRLEDIAGLINIWRGDISDYGAVNLCIKHARPEIVFHLAANRNVAREISLVDTMIETNLKGTAYLIKALVEENSPLTCFINAGSSEEYGNGEIPFNETQREIPVSPYSASKVASTYFCQMFQRSFGIPIVTLRPFLTYGPGQVNDMFIPSLIRHCIRKEDFRMTSGEQTRDFIFINDVIEAFLLAASTPEAIGKIFNIGSGIEYSIKEVAEMILDMTGSPIKLFFDSLNKRPGEANHFFCDNKKAKELLGWSPKIGLTEGLNKTIEWYKLNFQADNAELCL